MKIALIVVVGGLAAYGVSIALSTLVFDVDWSFLKGRSTKKGTDEGNRW